MLQGALGLGTPQFVGRDLDNAKTVALFSNIHHLFAPSRAICPASRHDCHVAPVRILVDF
jgi:hypothetical protein